MTITVVKRRIASRMNIKKTVFKGSCRRLLKSKYSYLAGKEEVFGMSPSVLITQFSFSDFSYIEGLILLSGPKIVWALVALVLGWGMGRGLGWAVHNMTQRWALGRFFKRSSIGRAILLSGYTPARFFGSLTKWLVYLVALYEAVEILEIPAVRTVMREAVLYIPSLISGLIILIIGFTAADFVADIVRQAGVTGTYAKAVNPFGDAIRLLLYFIVLVVTLSRLGIDVTILYMFAQPFAWSIALAIGIALGWHLKDRIGPWVDHMLPKPKRNEKGDQCA